MTTSRETPSKRAKKHRTHLASPEWKKLREAALERAGHRCQLCNVSAPKLQVHHRTYERLGRELVEDLTVLCAPCHRRHHAKELPSTKAERRLEIDAEILEIVEMSGLILWRDVQRQIKAPRAQAWARAEGLIRQKKLVWKGKMLCLYAKEDLL